jgi:hypothetical protein
MYAHGLRVWLRHSVCMRVAFTRDLEFMVHSINQEQREAGKNVATMKASRPSWL